MMAEREEDAKRWDFGIFRYRVGFFSLFGGFFGNPVGFSFPRHGPFWEGLLLIARLVPHGDL